MSFLLLIGPLGPFEILVILFVGLLIFGSRLPEVGKSLGKGLMEFKRGLRGIQDEMETIDRDADLKVDEELQRRAIPTNPAEENADLADDVHPDHGGDASADDDHHFGGFEPDDLQPYDPSIEDDTESYEDDPHLEPGPEFGGDPQPDADPVEAPAETPSPAAGSPVVPLDSATESPAAAVDSDDDLDNDTRAAPEPPTTSAASDSGTIVYADSDYFGDDDDKRD